MRMGTKQKTEAVKFLEGLIGKPLSFGGLTSAIRMGEDMSQVSFSKKLRISKAHLCDIEKGRRSVSAVRAAKFAKILGYSPERFVKVAIQDELDKAKLGLIVEIKEVA